MAESNLRKEKLCMIATHYGTINQLSKSIEELNELKVEIEALQEQNEIGLSIYPDPEPLIDEIADVKIMLKQLEILFDIKEKVKERMDFKIERQLGRMRNEIFELSENEYQE